MFYFAGDCGSSLLRPPDPDLLPAASSTAHNVLGAKGGKAQSKQQLSVSTLFVIFLELFCPLPFFLGEKCVCVSCNKSISSLIYI